MAMVMLLSAVDVFSIADGDVVAFAVVVDVVAVVAVAVGCYC